ncbi:MAG: TldD/PmbA family protein [Lachnospiraceae bacterium]|nr:TldD/PmbA family protein [Lachnospiraceae bacterium]
MKAPFSNYLNDQTPFFREIVSDLSSFYEYVSLLATDSVGFRVSLSQRRKTVSGSNMTTERGVVIRVSRYGLYSEFAFNAPEDICPRESVQGDVAAYAKAVCVKIRETLDAQLRLLARTKSEIYETGVLADEPLELFVEKETERLPEKEDMSSLIEYCNGLSSKGMERIEGALDVIVNGSSTHINKLFLTKNRFLRQSYVYTECSMASYGRNEDGEVKTIYLGKSGCKGPETFSELDECVDELAQIMKDTLKAGKIVPGEYEIITSPEVTGLIAHEAFGHGVEMDMFVKKRALGAEYLNKRIGSDLVTMHEGALCDNSVTAYAFDDEGVLAGDVTEIENGILRTGICDALAAVRLGVQPTGNGKRENYGHKVYTRMTNTIFDSGSSTKEEMIASVKYGYLLEGMESGMEDPKHWGIQCIIARGYEIKDGKLTGNVVAPVVMTGYVPDLLGNVSMISNDRCVYGNGGCGKGHKEWVKVADGGPYLKTKARLG